MNYPVKCTHCMSLLLNLKKYRFANYYKNCGQWYIDVQDETELTYISQLEWYQEGSFRMYNELVKITSNNHQS